jgi:sortase A
MRLILTYEHEDQQFFQQIVHAASMVFMCSGFAALLYAGYAVADRYWFQSVEIAAFENARVAAPLTPRALPPDLAPASPAAPHTAAPVARIADAAVIGEIEVPSVGLKAIVVQGDSDDVLRRAVGHLPETPLPGQAGNVGLAGHRDGLFRPLRDVHPGDTILLRTHSGDYQYRVDWMAVVAPEYNDLLLPTEESALTLVTCYPFNYVGPAPKRFIVRAHEVAGELPPTGTY